MSISNALITQTLRVLQRSATSKGFLISSKRAHSILLSDGPIEEGKIPGYDPKRFLPVNPGDLLNSRYKILVKLGWGTSSTVWLAQDIKRYVLLAWLVRVCTHTSDPGGGGVQTDTWL